MTKAKKLPSGSWRVNQYVGTDENGKKKYKSFTAPSKKEAEAAAQEYLVLNKEEEYCNLTFGKAREAYINLKRNVLSPSTIYGYERLKRNTGEIDDMKISEIRQTDIQRLVNNLSVTASPKTVRNTHGFISSVLKTFRPNLKLTTTLPQKEKPQIAIPSEDEIRTIHKSVKGTDLELPFLLAAMCGLRASEVVGIEKKNIDPVRKEIHIVQAIVYGTEGATKKKPKSDAGFRTVPASKEIIDLAMSQPGERVVPLVSGYLSHRWSKKMKKIGFPQYHYHSLRHYFASRALLLGIPQKYIAEMIGHASEEFLARVYQHTFPDAKKEFAERLIEDERRILFDD